MTLRDPPAFTQAPFEELLPLCVTSRGLKVVCFDLEVTGLALDDEIVQIGAKAWTSSFDQYVIPPSRLMHPDACDKTRLLVSVGDHDARRRLLDTRTNCELPAVEEREALLNFLAYLRSEAGEGEGEGLVLASHGAIFLDIPVLVSALHRNSLADDFFQTVLGMCDTNAIVQGRYKDRFPNRSLNAVYLELTAKHRVDVHGALVDATDLYTVLQKLFNKPSEELAFDNPDLWVSTWTPSCLLKYVAWALFWGGERRKALRETFAPLNNRLHKTVVHNLVLAGCTTSWLMEERRRLGLQTFRRLFGLYLRSVKSLHENYLTDSSMLEATYVANFVCNKIRLY